MRIYTIGFTQSTAEDFFGRLGEAGVRRLLDIRLSNSSQLAGFAKAQDLPYFCDRLLGATYEHEPLLAPTKEIMDAFKKRRGSWEEFSDSFTALMRERRIESALDPADFRVPTALLCSEATAERCHRRLICEYLADLWTDVEAVHI